MTKKRALLIAIPLLIIAAFFIPATHVYAGLLMATLYNLFALLIVGSFVALLGWYVFGIVLPGFIRYRKLRHLRYQRELNRRRRWDYDED